MLVEKVPPYLVAVRLLDDDFTALGRRQMRRALSLAAECVESGEWPGHEPYACARPQVGASQEEA